MSNHSNRFEFVEMLFALAIGQVAIEFSDLVIHKIGIFEYSYIYSHLILGITLITLSWVGWRNSHNVSDTSVIRSIFSLSFFILITDIILVICYFIVVKGAEITYIDGGGIAIGEPNAYLETKLACIIFFLYFIWDIITKLIQVHLVHLNNGSYKKTILINWEAFKNRVWQTLFCLFICSLTFVFFRHLNSEVEVLIIDLILIGVFFLFRGLKQNLEKERKEFIKELSPSLRASVVLKGQQRTRKISVVENWYWWKTKSIWILPLILIITLFIRLIFI